MSDKRQQAIDKANELYPVKKGFGQYNVYDENESSREAFLSGFDYRESLEVKQGEKKTTLAEDKASQERMDFNSLSDLS